jgi:uncharacterized protein (DUF983 family)
MWQEWLCPSCGGTLMLNEESVLEPWCEQCGLSMVADLDDDEVHDGRP